MTTRQSMRTLILPILVLVSACAAESGGQPNIPLALNKVIDYFKDNKNTSLPEPSEPGLTSPRLAAWLDHSSLQSLTKTARLAANAPEPIKISWQGQRGFQGFVFAEGKKYLNSYGQMCREMEQVAFRNQESKRQRMIYCETVTLNRRSTAPIAPTESPRIVTPSRHATPLPPSAADEEWETPPD